MNKSEIYIGHAKRKFCSKLHLVGERNIWRNYIRVSIKSNILGYLVAVNLRGETFLYDVPTIEEAARKFQSDFRLRPFVWVEGTMQMISDRTHQVVTDQAKVKGKLRHLDYDIRTFTPKFKEECPISEIIKEEVSAVSDDHLRFEHVAEKDEDSRYNNLLKLMDDPIEPDVSTHDIIKILAMMFLKSPRYKGEPHYAQSLDPEEKFDILVGDSSAGIGSVNCPFAGSKKDNYVQAHMLIEEAANTGKCGAAVYKPAVKQEVLKVEKIPRLIFVDPLWSYIAQQAAFGYHIHSPGNPFLGNAIGMKFAGNSYSQIFMRLTDFAGELSVEERKKIIKDRGFCESDKEGWDFKVSKLAKLIYVMYLIGSTKIHEYWIPALVQSLSSFICPYVGIYKGNVVQADNLMPSGVSLTLKANTEIHEMYIIHYALTQELDQELEALCSYLVLGDDFYSLKNGHSESCAKFMDNVWGTKTKHSDHDEGIFCHRFMDLDAQQLRRKRDRVLGRLYHFRGDVKSALQCVNSLSKESNDVVVTNVCKKIYERANACDSRRGRVKTENTDYDVQSGDLFLNNKIVRAFHLPDHQLFRDVVREREAAEFGCSLAQFKDMF